MDQQNESISHAPLANAAGSGLTADLFECADRIDLAAWSSVVSDSDWPMHPEVIAVQAHSLADQARIWCLAMKDRSGHCQACGALALFQTDIVQASPQPLRHAVGGMRRLWPNAMRMGILFCGLPVPDGGNHLRVAATADITSVLRCLDTTMQQLARRHGARLLVFKEFDGSEMVALSGLKTLGYISGDIPPMHRLTRTFASFDAYRNALRSGYRRQVDASIAKFEAAGMSVAHYRDPQDIAIRFTDDLHRLYLNVLHRNETRLEVWPASFFRNLPQALPGQCILTVIERDGRPFAFAFGLDDDGCYSNLYVGVDYDANQDADLYFNAFYQPMRAAFARGVHEIKLGATSDSFKSRLGSLATPAHFFARTASPVIQPLFRAASRSLFPAIEPISPRNVFKQQPEGTRR